MGILIKTDLLLTFTRTVRFRRTDVEKCVLYLKLLMDPPGWANTFIYNMWQCSTCILSYKIVFRYSKRVFGYFTMYSYRSAHNVDMWVNTPFSCRICHIMPSEICHSFFMLLQDPIFILTCMLTLDQLRKCFQ